jgi:retinol-binding protein 3
MSSIARLIRLFAAVLACGALAAVASAETPGTSKVPGTSLSAATKAEVLHSLAQNLREQYVFPGVAERLAGMLASHEQHGDYASVGRPDEFSRLLTAEMAEIAHDRHLQVFYKYFNGTKIPIPVPRKAGQRSGPSPKMLRQVRSDNYGFEEAKRLPGNVGYLKVMFFTDPDLVGPTVAAAMTFLSHTGALIIDLRHNMGGVPDTVDLLATYFFSAQSPVHLNDLSLREKGTAEHSVQQFWTLPYVPGRRYLGKEVYILTSPDTKSAGEEFTYDLQALKRAVIVGEPTWGGANPGDIVPLGDDFFAFIPTGEAINPITKTNWEGKGVQPDIRVAAKDAFRVAYATALEHLMAKTRDKEELSALKGALACVQSGKECDRP